MTIDSTKNEKVNKIEKKASQRLGYAKEIK